VRALVEAVDFPMLEARAGADAWLYFYETFLARYDPILRDQYGVYYTPAPVITAQVALVDEIIREHFERPDGLAADGITLLDPAVGTGSYLLQVITTAAARAAATHGQGAVPGVISGLANNLFAFEVLVGPYAVAHLRISEVITHAGGSLPTDGPHVYLTDTLENPYSEPLDLGRQLEPLVAERRRALHVKSRQDILVCLGNPPYERLSGADETGAAQGGWVVHGEGGGSATRIFRHFLDPARQHTCSAISPVSTTSMSTSGVGRYGRYLRLLM
jgi:predicted helicase